MGITLSEEELEAYNAMRVRVDAFIEKHEISPAYDFDRTGVDVSQATIELDDCVRLYATGGVDERGVEACARLLLLAYKRPEAVERGSKSPPLPPPGTYPGRVQAGHAKQMSRTPAVLRSSLEITHIDRGVPQALCPDVWRYAILLVEHPGNGGLGYFVDKPLKAGAYGYAKYNEHSLVNFAERPELWAVQFYSPDTQVSYYFKTHEVEAHAPADHQGAIDAAWSRGFSSRK